MTLNDVAFLGASGVSIPKVQPTLVRVGTNELGGSATLTISAFNCSGGNFMVIGFAWSSGTPRAISSITVNGVAATNIYNTNYNSTTTGKVGLYGLVNPTTGDVVVTLNSAPTSLTISAMLFNNVGGVGASSGDFLSTARTSTSDSLTTLSSDLVVDAEAYSGSTAFPTVAGGQTLQIQSATAAGGNLSNGTKAGGAGSTTVTWNSASQTLAWVGTVLNGM